MVRIIPKGMQFWPQDASDNLAPDDVQQMYVNGFVGAWDDPEAREVFRDTIRNDGGQADADDALSMYRLIESGAGKLILLSALIEKVYPGALPGPAQTRGDCVSHSAKNSALATMVAEALSGKPDEVTGKTEEAPQVSADGIANGVLSTEAIYWWRRHGGDGWQCADAARVLVKESGMWLRQSYPELGVDLTRYSGKTAGLYGSKTPPESFLKTGQQHLIRTATEVRGFDQLRDLLANGYGVSSCGSEGFSNQRDANGVSRRSGSWAHAMAYLGADDRPETTQAYGEPLVLVQNSWAKWNSGPRTVRGTNMQIPEGSFWAKWSDVRNRYMVAMSSSNGWPARNIDWAAAWGTW